MQISRILAEEGTAVRVLGLFYWVIVQYVIIFEADTWVPLARLISSLEGLHVCFARSIIGKCAKLDTKTGGWEYSPTVKILKVVSLQTTK